MEKTLIIILTWTVIFSKVNLSGMSSAVCGTKTEYFLDLFLLEPVNMSGLAFISSPVTLQNNFLFYQISLSRCFVSVATTIYIVAAPIITFLIFKLYDYPQVKKIKANGMEKKGQFIFKGHSFTSVQL